MLKTIVTLIGLVLYASWCSATYTPQYESYTTISADATKIYQTVVVDGTTSGDCNYPCNCNQYGCQTCPLANCPGDHTPKINNVLGTAGGWSSGTQTSMFNYISYQTTVSITATNGTLYPNVTEGAVYCVVAAGFIYDALSQSYSAKNPLCGGNSAVVKVFAPAKTVTTCNGTARNTAAVNINGSGAPAVQKVNVTTSTDNLVLLDLLGGPYNFNTTCTDKPGSSTWCYSQDFTGATPTSSPNRSGNIRWNWNIFCSASASPDIFGTTPQHITCQP